MTDIQKHCMHFFSSTHELMKPLKKPSKIKIFLFLLSLNHNFIISPSTLSHIPTHALSNLIFSLFINCCYVLMDLLAFDMSYVTLCDCLLILSTMILNFLNASTLSYSSSYYGETQPQIISLQLHN